MKMQIKDIKPGSVFQIPNPIHPGMFCDFLKLRDNKIVNLNTYSLSQANEQQEAEFSDEVVQIVPNDRY